MRSEIGFLCLKLLVNAQGPTRRSLHFSCHQGTFLLHGLHEEALRRDDRLDSYCAQLSDHSRRGRTLPQTSIEARIKTSNSLAAQRFTGNVSKKRLHYLGWSKSLCWTP